MQTFLPAGIEELLRDFFLAVRYSWLFAHAHIVILIGVPAALALVLIIRPRPRGTLAIAFFATILLGLFVLDRIGLLVPARAEWIPDGANVPWNASILCSIGSLVAGALALVDGTLRRLPIRALVGPALCLITSIVMYGFMATILIANYGF